MASKSKPSVKGLVFSRGVVLDRDLVAIISESPSMASKGTGHTKLLIYKSGSFSNHVVSWPSVAIMGVLKPSLEVLVAGADGEILRGVRGSFSEENLDDSAEGPENVGPLRDIAFIGRKVFAVGMARQAYRRDQPGKWIRIDSDIRAEPVLLKGFNAVDGFAEDDVYAVGLNGEIVRYNGKKWRILSSPTNLQLHRVHCAEKKQVYACGTGGILLKGNGDKFQPIEHESTEDNLYGLHWFAGRLYVASLTGIFRLEDEELVALDLGLGTGITSGYLHSADGVMWSFGAKHLAFTEDGLAWNQIFVT